jgi:Sulfotransferase family
VKITRLARARRPEALRDFRIERPRRGGIDRTTLEIAGWIVGRHSQARQVEVRTSGRLLRTIPLRVPRPDVVKKHPDAPERSGFWALAGSIGLEREFALDLEAVLEDGTRTSLGSVHGERTPLKTSYKPRLRPLLVTSLGRTGTTLLMNLLSSHPQVVAYRTYPYEMFPAKYWLHMLRVLAEPANHLESSPAEGFTDDFWRIGHNPFHTAPVTDRPELVQLLGKAYVERLAAFCQESIDQFYSALATAQDQPAAQFFAEKFQPGYLPRLVWDLYPDTKEIILVRDFRDVICSVFAFNEKRHTTEFGRETVESDEEYVFYIAQSARQLLENWQSRRGIAHLVRYEDLIRWPEETTGRMLEYLELPREPDIVAERAAGAFGDPATEFHRTTRTAEESIGRWERELPPSLVTACDEAFGDVLTEFGYGGATTAPRGIGRRLRAKLGLG